MNANNYNSSSVISITSSAPSWNLQFALTVKDYMYEDGGDDSIDLKNIRKNLWVLDDSLRYYPSFALSLNKTDILSSLNATDILNYNVTAQWIMCEMLSCPGDENSWWFTNPTDNSDKNYKHFYFKSESNQYELEATAESDEMVYVPNSTLPSLPSSFSPKPSVGTYLAYALVEISFTTLSDEEPVQVYISSLKETISILPYKILWSPYDASKMEAIAICVILPIFIANAFMLLQLVKNRKLGTNLVSREWHFSFLIVQILITLVKLAMLFEQFFVTRGAGGVIQSCRWYAMITFINNISTTLYILRWSRIYINAMEGNTKKLPVVFRCICSVFSCCCCRWGFIRLRQDFDGDEEKKTNTVNFISTSQYWGLFIILNVGLFLFYLSNSTLRLEGHILDSNDDINLVWLNCYRDYSIVEDVHLHGLFLLLLATYILLRSGKDVENHGEIRTMGKYLWINYIFISAAIILPLIAALNLYALDVNTVLWVLLSCLTSCPTLPLAYYYLNIIWNSTEARVLTECKRASNIFDGIIRKLSNNEAITLAEWMIFRRQVQDLAEVSKRLDKNE